MRPRPAHRNAVESYANAHAKDASGALARLGLGVAAYQQLDYATALASLKQARDKLPKLADYTGYYLAATRVELKDTAGLAEDLAPAPRGGEPSPLAAKSWLLEARALKTTAPAEGIRILREHYAALPQPEGDLRMADCYQAANDLPRAAEFYQRVYYQYLTGDAANLAAAALVALRDAMGAAYPQPSPQLMLRRADKLMEIREYAKARAEYAGPLAQIQGLEGEQARVRIGAADYFKGKASAAATYLRGLELAVPEADAERWYYLEECARRMGDDEAMMAAVKTLGERHPKSPWRLGAVVSAANRYLLVNRADAYIPLYRPAYQDFPDDPGRRHRATGKWHSAPTSTARAAPRTCSGSTCASIPDTPPPGRRSTSWGAARNGPTISRRRGPFICGSPKAFPTPITPCWRARGCCARKWPRRALSRERGTVSRRHRLARAEARARRSHALDRRAHRALAPVCAPPAWATWPIPNCASAPATMASRRCWPWRWRARPQLPTWPCAS